MNNVGEKATCNTRFQWHEIHGPVVRSPIYTRDTEKEISSEDSLGRY